MINGSRIKANIAPGIIHLLVEFMVFFITIKDDTKIPLDFNRFSYFFPEKMLKIGGSFWKSLSLYKKNGDMFFANISPLPLFITVWLTDFKLIISSFFYLTSR
jgi:hypothetical protein